VVPNSLTSDSWVTSPATRDAITWRHAPVARTFLPTWDRSASACPKSGSKTARAQRGSRSPEILIGPGFRQVERPTTPSPGYSAVSSARRFAAQSQFRAENLQPVGCAAAVGSLNLSEPTSFALMSRQPAAATSRGILDAHPTQLQRWEGIRYGLGLIVRPAWRRSGEHA
jgi:hypothetical protein